MNVALLYLTLCSIKNRMRVRLQRLRSPRYALGLAVGVIYLYTMFFRRRRGSAAALGLFHKFRAPIELAGAVVLLLVTAGAWVWPAGGRPALAFSRAEVQFLFTAPISRRRLLHYKILRSQIGALVGSAFMTLFFRPASLSSGWIFFVGVALIMAVMNLHLTAVSLARESLGTHGRSAVARQWLPPALAGGAILVLAAMVLRDWATLSSLPGRELLQELDRLSRTGAAGVVLWPFRALTRLPLSESPAGFARALPAALGILALNYGWVMRSDTAFEEASAEFAEKAARTRRGPQPVAPGRRTVPTPFALSLHGRPEAAILWKNLILLGRYISLRTLGRLLLVLGALSVVVFSSAHAPGGVLSVAGPGCLVLAAFIVFLGPQMMRNDLRQDLAQLAVLKTWPVRGASLVRGEVLAPALVLIVCTWLLLAGAAIFSGASVFGAHPPSPFARLSYAVAAMLLAPGLILVQLLVQNGLAVMYPSWVAVGPSRARGVDVMGQRMLLVAGMLLAVFVAVLPAALTGGAIAFAVYLLTRTVIIVVPLIVCAIVLLAEAFIGTEILGRLLERTDIAEVDAEA